MKIFLSIIALTVFISNSSRAQNMNINIGSGQAIGDSSFVIQTNTSQSYNQGNHPGAGPYSNGEIYLCSGSSLSYSYQIGTSNLPTFYLDENSTLNLNASTFANVYMKSGSTLNCMSLQHYLIVHRVSNASVVNTSTAANITQSVYPQVNFTFNSWPNSTNPCNVTTVIQNNVYESNSIYPNPTNDVIVVNLNYSNYIIRDIKGNTVIKIDDLKSEKIDLSFLTSGVYYVEYENQNKKHYCKLIKM